MPKLGQAVRNAIAAERLAARFYTALRGRAGSELAKALFTRLASQEETHAAAIEALSLRLDAGELPTDADHDVSVVETPLGWAEAEEITLRQGVTLALEAEHHAAQVYDALADCFEGEGARFFRDLATVEEDHARWLEDLAANLD